MSSGNAPSELLFGDVDEDDEDDGADDADDVDEDDEAVEQDRPNSANASLKRARIPSKRDFYGFCDDGTPGFLCEPCDSYMPASEFAPCHIRRRNRRCRTCTSAEKRADRIAKRQRQNAAAAASTAHLASAVLAHAGVAPPKPAAAPAAAPSKQSLPAPQPRVATIAQLTAPSPTPFARPAVPAPVRPAAPPARPAALPAPVRYPVSAAGAAQGIAATAIKITNTMNAAKSAAATVLTAASVTAASRNAPIAAPRLVAPTPDLQRPVEQARVAERVDKIDKDRGTFKPREELSTVSKKALIDIDIDPDNPDKTDVLTKIVTKTRAYLAQETRQANIIYIQALDEARDHVVACFAAQFNVDWINELIRAQNGHSAAPLWRASTMTGALGIDRIDLGSPMCLENAIALDMDQIDARAEALRRGLPDPLPTHYKVGAKIFATDLRNRIREIDEAAHIPEHLAAAAKRTAK